MRSVMKFSVVILMALILSLTAISDVAYAQTSFANGTLKQTLVQSSIYHGNATINVTFDPGYYMRSLVMNLSWQGLYLRDNITNVSNNVDTNFIVIVKALPPYTTYTISLKGSYSSCYYPGAQASCQAALLPVSLTKSVTTGANGSVVDAAFYLSNPPPTSTVNYSNSTGSNGNVFQSLWNAIISFFKSIANLFH